MVACFYQQLAYGNALKMHVELLRAENFTGKLIILGLNEVHNAFYQ